jgi:hypothetical protein
VATAQTVEVVDPVFLSFVERMIEKGFFPALVVIGLFVLVAKFGWPWQGRNEPPHAPPAPAESKGVVDALVKLDDKLDSFRLEVVQRLTRLETKMKLPPHKGGDE